MPERGYFSATGKDKILFPIMERPSSYVRYYVIVCLLLLLLASCTQGAPAKKLPDFLEKGNGGKMDIRRNDVISECLPGSPTKDICERCAKLTKSMLAYPLCCNGSVNVRGWCQNFLTFSLDEESA